MLILPVLHLRRSGGEKEQYNSSHVPTHGLAWLFDLCVNHDVLYCPTLVMLQQRYSGVV